MTRPYVSSLVLAVILVMAWPVAAQDFTQPGSGTANFTVTGTHQYFDSGGIDCDPDGEYGSQEYSVAVICPGTAGEFVTVTFLDVDIETRSISGVCWDSLTIYDGNSISSPEIFFGCGEDGFASCPGNPGDGSDADGNEGGPYDMNGANTPSPANYVFTSTDLTGCLTFEFQSDFSNAEGGWVADVTAAVPVELMSLSVE